VIPFKDDMKAAILEGILAPDGRRVFKHVTRRRWKRPHVKVGGWYGLYTRMPWGNNPGKPFARVQVVKLDVERLVGECFLNSPLAYPVRLADMEAQREGFPDWATFCRRYEEINGAGALALPCSRVEWDPATMEVLDG